MKMMKTHDLLFAIMKWEDGGQREGSFVKEKEEFVC
jgi:hypothetical protein